MTVILTGVFVLLTMVPLTLLAKDAPSGTILVTKADPSGARKPSIFTHAKHENYDCELCHHAWDGENEIKKCASCHPIFHHTEHLGMGCEQCHESWEMNKDIKKCGSCHPGNDKGGIPNIIKVSHRALCKRCHRDMVAAGKISGPTNPCTACHMEN